MEKALLTALAAVAGFLGKSIWDLYWKRREQVETLAKGCCKTPDLNSLGILLESSPL